MERITNYLKILKLAKKRKRVTLKDADWQSCEQLVHRGLLHKNFPDHDRSYGWPEYKISKKGIRYIQQAHA